MTKRKRSTEDTVAAVLKKAKHYVIDQGLVSVDNKEEEYCEEDEVKRKASKADRERKREKKKLKNLRKQHQRSGIIDTGPTLNLGLEYLRQWSTNRSQWKFQKSRQNWLIKNSLDTKKFSDEDFSMALQYFASMNGAARNTIQSKALDIVRKFDEERENGANAETEELSKVYCRAREIIQIMA